MKEFKFNNPELQRVHDENKEFLESRIKQIEQISDDIKQMEYFLHLRACKEISMPIDHKNSTYSDYLLFKDGRIWLSLQREEPKRLGETKSFIRLEYGKYLPEFMKYCIETLKPKEYY